LVGLLTRRSDYDRGRGNKGVRAISFFSQFIKTVLEIFFRCEASNGFRDLAQYILGDRRENHVVGNVRYLREHLLGT
jgi:hypothetical protein